MLKILEDEAAIRRGQRQFTRSFKPFADEKITVKIGHPGASFRAGVLWSERLGIWFFSRKMSQDRYWNVFGIGRPKEGIDPSIACEINFPLQGIDRKTGGALAEDREGRIFVVHRGKIGGGRKGIGKTLFEDRYRGVWVRAQDGDEETTVALIGAPASSRFARKVMQFVRKIDSMKAAAASSRRRQMEIAFSEHDFREERVGEKYGRFERDLEAESDRDLVVRDLSEVLRREGCRIGNDDTCDLFVLGTANRAGAVFGVCSSVSPAALYAEAARLLLAGRSRPGNPRLLLAVPAGAEIDDKEKLEGLNIELVAYEWQRDGAVFPGLNAAFDDMTIRG